jgi:hypothetical protein
MCYPIWHSVSPCRYAHVDAAAAGTQLRRVARTYGERGRGFHGSNIIAVVSVAFNA